MKPATRHCPILEGIFEFSSRPFDVTLSGSELSWRPIKAEIPGIQSDSPEEYSIDISDEVIGLKIRKMKIIKGNIKKSVVTGFSLITLVRVQTKDLFTPMLSVRTFESILV